MPLASRTSRLLAQILDDLVAVVAVGIFMPFSIFLSRPLLLVPGFLLAMIYTLVSDGFERGQSWGKRVMHIATVDATTLAPCRYGQSALRNLLLMILGVIDWVFIFGRRRQRLGDMAANTIVVDVR
jgi:uncharacterized RDD family membrane protein YckC